MAFLLPKGLLMGVSTAATQIEGGDVNSNWNDWFKQGKISDGTDPATANDHWEKWETDTELMSQLGIEIYRFSIEWARLMPQAGQVDEAAIDRYRRELLLLCGKKIRPLLTIHHFTNPMWFELLGGFTRRENLHYYLELVELVAERFGDLVSDYITINEPNVYATNSFFFGQWPPGEQKLLPTLRVMENLAYCHIRAYEILHRKRENMGFTDTRVGCANHLRVFAPKNPKNPWHRLCARLNSYLFQDALTKAMTLGKFPFPLRNFGKLPKGEYTDFIGLNYYTRSTVHSIGDGVRENSPPTTWIGRSTPKGWRTAPGGSMPCCPDPSGSRRTAPVTGTTVSAAAIFMSICRYSVPLNYPLNAIITGVSAIISSGWRAIPPVLAW